MCQARWFTLRVVCGGEDSNTAPFSLAKSSTRSERCDWRLSGRSSVGLYFVTIISIYLSIYLWLYSLLLGLGCFFIFLIFTQAVGLLGWGISPSQGRWLYTGQHKHRINVNRHPYLKGDSNPWPQCSSGRRRFMPQTARPLLSAS
jgi:hypothetical protein